MDLTKTLARYVAELTFKDLPVKIVENAKFSILDTIGVILAGSTQTSSRVMVDLVREFGGCAESSVIGQGFKTSSMHAALANGAMGHALDFDDTTKPWIPGTRGGLHAGSPIISAGLAIAELVDVSGKDFITAVTAAYDIGERLSYSCNPSDQVWIFHPSGIFGTFAATAIASKLFQFDASQVANAFGIAGSMASGVLQCLLNGSPMKRVHSGLAARNGVLSALLTRKELPGPEDIFEGQYGFFKAYYQGVFDPEKITAKLGEEFAVGYNTFKLYPVCGETHASIDAVLDLMATHGLQSSDVDKATVWVNKVANAFCCEPADRKYCPETMVDIQFNVPFAVAVALSKGQVTLKEVSEAGMHDPEVLTALKKVTIREDLTLARPQSRVDLVLTDGRTITRQIDVPKGLPESSLPWSYKDLIDKFRSCASIKIHDSNQVEEVLKMLNNLEIIDSMVSIANKIRLE